MNLKRSKNVTIVCLFNCNIVLAQGTNEQHMNQIEYSFDKIQITSHDIFDESLPSSTIIHHFANALHINTQQNTIRKLLPFSDSGKVSEDQIKEAERILNKTNYLRKATIKHSEICLKSCNQVLEVDTWDTWSLLPTVSFGRQAGENKFAIGFKDDNLLGLGISSSVNYRHRPERNGYGAEFNLPLSWPVRSEFTTNLANNSDGKIRFFEFKKPFHYLDDPYQYRLNNMEQEQVDVINQSGETWTEFNHKTISQFISTGWSINKWNRKALRWGITFEKQNHIFNAIDKTIENTLPEDYGFDAAGITLEYFDSDFQMLSNVNLINYREDFNLGWHIKAHIQRDITVHNNFEESGEHAQFSLTKGWQWGNYLALFNINSQHYWRNGNDNWHNTRYSAEIHNTINLYWSSFHLFQQVFSSNQWEYEPTALGGNSGVRGYPKDFRHGDNYWSLTNEIRYNPHINYFQMFNLSWAAFADSGNTWGGNYHNNSNESTLHSIGVGARLFSSHSSQKNVVHFDFIVPLSNEKGVKQLEWRVQVKHRL